MKTYLNMSYHETNEAVIWNLSDSAPRDFDAHYGWEEGTFHKIHRIWRRANDLALAEEASSGAPSYSLDRSDFWNQARENCRARYNWNVPRPRPEILSREEAIAAAEQALSDYRDTGDRDHFAVFCKLFYRPELDGRDRAFLSELQDKAVRAVKKAAGKKKSC